MRDDVNLAVVEQPGHVGVDAVAGKEAFGIPCSDFRCYHLARVNGGDEKEAKLRANYSAVSHNKSMDVEAGQRCAMLFVPTVAYVDPGGEVRVLGCQRGEVGVGLFHRAITGKLGT